MFFKFFFKWTIIKVLMVDSLVVIEKESRVDTPLFLSKYFQEIFSLESKLNLSNCTRVTIFGENQPTQLGGSSFINLILSTPLILSSGPYLNVRLSSLCSVVIYLNSLINSSLTEINENWVIHLPGTDPQSFHFFIELNLNFDRYEHEFWTLPFLRRLSNAIVIHKVTKPCLDSSSEQVRDDECWIFLSPNRVGTNPKYFVVARLNDKSRLDLSLNRLFWNKWKDLEGNEFRISVPSTSAVESKLVAYRNKGRIFLQAIVCVELTRMMNATLKVIQNDISTGFGHPLKNGTWTSYIGQILQEKTDLSLPFTPFPFQYKILGMSKGAIFSPLKFFTPLPKKTEVTFMFLIKPFQPSCWLAIFISILANVATIYLLVLVKPAKNNVDDYLKTQETKWRFRDHIYFWVLKMLHFFRVLIDQPIPDEMLSPNQPNAYRIRFIFLIWLMGIGIVVKDLYQSVVISVLVEPVYLKPPETFEELIKSDFHINFIMYKAFHFEKRLEWIKDLKYPVRDYGGNFSECLKSILDGPNVCLFVHNYLYLRAANDLVDAHGKILFAVSKDAILYTVSSFGMSQQNPQLKSAVNDMVSVILEGGQDVYWTIMQFYQTSLHTIHKKQKEDSGEEIILDDLVDQKIMKKPNFLLAGGLAISFFVFGLEMFYVL